VSRRLTLADASTRRPDGPLVLVTQVGAATGSRAAAAALACAASEPDRAALLIDLDEGRAPRSTLVATAGARELEERLAAHLADAAVASRGRLCQLALPAGPKAVEAMAAALPLVRESAGIIHLPPSLLRPVLEEVRIRPTAALLRADLAWNRALTALAARDLIREGLRVSVLKRSLGWMVERVALLGALSPDGEALPARVCRHLLTTEDKKLRTCYDESNGAESDQGEVESQEPHRFARPRWGQYAGRSHQGKGRM